MAFKTRKTKVGNVSIIESDIDTKTGCVAWFEGSNGRTRHSGKTFRVAGLPRSCENHLAHYLLGKGFELSRKETKPIPMELKNKIISRLKTKLGKAEKLAAK